MTAVPVSASRSPVLPWRDAARVGWCPGALRPMQAGDGLLVRIKPRGNRLPFAAARGLAALAGRFGNGALTLTARGNIQVRGVGEASLPFLTEGLDRLGLLDRTPEGEAVRNVLSNPLAGADPTALIELGPAVAALERRLAGDAALWRLPAKFAWTVDAGGRLGLAGALADVTFEAVRRADAVGLRVRVNGGRAAAWCAPDAIVAVAARLAQAFLDLCAATGLAPHRMRDLVASLGAPAVLGRAGLVAESEPDDAVAAPAAPVVGCHTHGPWSFVGAAPAFGLLDAATLDEVAGRTEAAGAADLRLTPWRGLLIPGLGEGAAARLARDLAATPLILDPADPRLGVVACVGQPACHRATTPVPSDAGRLAALAAGRGTLLHVSGCAKGCADPRATPLTLVGRAGRYDLVRDGRAGDPPIAQGLSLDAAMVALREMVP